MGVVEFAATYLLIGGACGAMSLRRSGETTTRAVDLVMLVPLWPLLAPLIFGSRETGRQVDAAKTRGAEDLWERRDRATAQLARIDEVLAKPSFDLEALERRIEQLRSDQTKGLAFTSALARSETIRRLVGQRKRLADELDELDELFLQLETQTDAAELVGAADATTELIIEIQARLESISLLDSMDGTQVNLT